MTGTDSPSRTFLGVRFLLRGFELATETNVRSKLLNGGGIEAREYNQSCTHVIVDQIVYDDPVCVAARDDGKTLVTGLWVDHSFEVGVPVDHTSDFGFKRPDCPISNQVVEFIDKKKKIIYRPLKDLNGIPGAKHLIMCLTGYQRQDRDDIMTMVGLMAAQFSKPLVANKVTHLICYKFEGEKYELANKLKRIKLVNHRWLEDCLRDWKLLPEENYTRSGYELEMMEAEAKDSDEDAEETKTKQRSPDVKENIQNLQDASNATGSLEKGDQALGIGRLSATEEDSSHEAGTSTNAASVQSPDPQDRTPQSMKVASNFKSLLRSAEKSSQPDMKFGASSTGNTQRRSPKSIFSREPSRVESSSKLCLGDSMHVPNIENIEHVKDLFASGCDEPQKQESEFLFAETSIGKKQKMEASSPTPRVEKACLTASLSPSGFQAKSLANHLPRSDRSPLSGSHVGDMLEREKVEEINSNGVVNGLKTLESYGKHGCHIIGTIQAHETGEPVELQEQDQGEGTTSRGCAKSEQKLPSTPASLDKDDKENAKTVAKPMRTKTVARKTLGSRPKLNSTINQKGSIFLHKTGGNDDPTISKDVECKKTDVDGSSNSSEQEKGHATLDVASEEVQNKAILGDGKGSVTKTSFVDDETEGPEEREECGTVLVEKNFKLSCTAGKLKEILRDPQFDVDVLKGEIEDGSKANLIPAERNKPDESTSNGNGRKPKLSEGQKHSLGDTVINADEIPDLQGIDGKAVGKKRGRLTQAGKTKNETTSQKKSKNVMQVEKENHPSVSGDINQSSSKENRGKEAIISHEAFSETSQKKRGKLMQAGKTKNKTTSHKKPKNGMQLEEENHPSVGGDENQSSSKENLGKKAVTSHETFSEISQKIEKSDEKPTPMIDTPNLVERPPAYFILSGHRLQRKEFQRVIKHLRGKCCRDSHQWSYPATHYISPDPIRRTEKFFAAAASGRWILRTDYLTACNQAGKFLPEEPFEWHKNGLSEDGAINLEAPRKWRLLRARTGHGAFYGLRVVIYGECIAPTLDTLKRVLKAGDGTILATSPPYTRFLTSGVDYAVISPGMPRVDMWVQEFLKHEIPCIVADYLVDYVCKPGYSLERHVLYGSLAWAEKSFANLLKKAEEVIEV